MRTKDTGGTFIGRKPALLWLVGGSAAVLLIALAAATILNALSPASYPAREAALVGVVALLVALPLLLACSIMAAKIDTLRKEAQRLGQRDVLTACLNESTFSALVDTYANRDVIEAGSTRGTVLLINIDDFQVVNDRFGYSWGNDALARVAAAIRDTVRQGDIVGRISGNQFGVFLPGADEINAKSVANRIYDTVSKIDFFPTGVQYPLSIRAGAVTVSDKASFDELLHTAVDSLAVTEGADQVWIHYASLNGRPQGDKSNLQ